MIFKKTTGIDPYVSEPDKDYVFYWQLWHHNWDDSDIDCILSHCDLKNKLVLEVGCGDGRVAFALASHCRELVAIDTDKKFVGIANSRLTASSNNLLFKEMDAQALAFPDESFDLVVYSWVL